MEDLATTSLTCGVIGIDLRCFPRWKRPKLEPKFKSIGGLESCTEAELLLLGAPIASSLVSELLCERARNLTHQRRRQIPRCARALVRSPDTLSTSSEVASGAHL